MAAGQEYLMPGFSHGTAGVGYALAAEQGAPPVTT
jgi:hypothetical protein